MALHQSYTFTTANQFLIDLAAFMSANGWTIDFNGVYNTSWRRLHVHQGEAHFDLVSSSTTLTTGYGCTGYAGGSAPSAQPGVSAAKTFTGTVGYGYRFVSVAGGIYIAVLNSSGNFLWGGCFIVSNKIGAWTNGFGMVGALGSILLGQSAYSSTNGYAQLYYSGAWSSNNVAANGFCGSNTNSDIASSSRQPNLYNGGIVPFPVVLFIRNATDSVKKHPVGYAPGLYRVSGGDIYSIGDEIIIGGDTYLMLPGYSGVIGSLAGACDYLFKLGS